ncbi:MAG: hypothetical protein IJW84_01955 [Alphaproteobacteria bacterium]|nr:hypothetical protein [Alphaproteobacteria bacterium]
MIRQIIQKFIIAISVIFITAFGAHANTDKCLQALANDLVTNLQEHVDSDNDVVIISSDGLVEFFTENIDVCRDYLLARTSPDEDISVSEPDLFIEVNWDYLVDEVAAALTTTGDSRQLFVCENNRSWQAGIDALLWVATAVAAVFSWGSGGVAVQAGKTAVVQGAKNLTKIGVKKGIKTAVIDATSKRLGVDIAAKAATKAAAEAAVKEAGKTTAKAVARDQAVVAAKSAATAAANDAVVISTKASLKSAGKKRVTDAMIKKEIQAGIANGTIKGPAGTRALNLIDDKAAKAAAKRTAQKAVQAEVAAANTELANATAALTAEQALASKALTSALAKFAISTPIAAAGGIASVYSYLESGFNPQIMNCTDTDEGEGCYTSCSKDSLNSPTDDLNTKVFKPIFGKNLCIDESNNYVLREISNTGLPSAGNVFMTTNEKWATAKAKIASDVQDKGNCDWNEDDIDLYVGAPLYDPSTLMPADNGATGLLIDGMRLDD